MMPSSQKLDQLTTTRFVAALSVLFFHGGTGVLFDTFPIRPLLISGPTAVSYFFTLSGFVMALAYYRPGKPFNLRDYAVARFSRIYPVYLLAFMVTCLYYLDLLAVLGSRKMWANLLLIQAWIPGYAESYNIAAWSLSVEAFFYIVFPLLALLAMRLPVRRLLWISLGFWAASQFVHSLLYMRFMPDYRPLLLFFPPFHLSGFLLGMAGGIWYLSESQRRPVKPGVAMVLLSVGLGLFSAALIVREFSPDLVRAVSLDIGLLAPFFLVIILALASDTTRFSRALSHPWLVLLGDASYALYILHVPVRWLCKRLLEWTGGAISYEAMFAIYAPVMIALSVAVFLWLERPARDWLRGNFRRMMLVVLDLALIALAIKLSFVLRVGADAVQLERMQTFSMRVGLAVFFAALIVFRVYRKYSWIKLALAILLALLVHSSLVYLAYHQGWIEAFSRSILLLESVLIFGMVALARLPFRRWMPDLIS